MDKILKELTIGDLPKKYREIATVIGIDNFIKLSRTFGGNHFYIPQQDAIIKDKIYKTITEDIEGTNKLQIETKYHLS